MCRVSRRHMRRAVREMPASGLERIRRCSACAAVAVAHRPDSLEPALRDHSRLRLRLDGCELEDELLVHDAVLPPRAGAQHGGAVAVDGDYYGAAVNIAARVAGEARAGSSSPIWHLGTRRSGPPPPSSPPYPRSNHGISSVMATRYRPEHVHAVIAFQVGHNTMVGGDVRGGATCKLRRASLLLERASWPASDVCATSAPQRSCRIQELHAQGL